MTKTTEQGDETKLNFLNLIFPPTCELCGKVGTYLCEDCYKKIKAYQIKNNNSNFMYLYRYEDIIRTLMLQYKFNDKSYLYKLFSELLIKNKKVCKFIKKYDIITPVPVHKKRKLERGYNQSELIVKDVAKKLGIDTKKVSTKILIKTKNNKPQSTKTAKERAENVKNIFKVTNIEHVTDKKILIFDDIYTTGNTIKECKKVLINAGAKKVGALTITKKYNK